MVCWFVGVVDISMCSVSELFFWSECSKDFMRLGIECNIWNDSVDLQFVSTSGNEDNTLGRQSNDVKLKEHFCPKNSTYLLLHLFQILARSMVQNYSVPVS